MRGSRPRVYLAGPITGLSYNGSTEWRESVSRELLPYIIGVSPMRGKDYLKGLEVIDKTPDTLRGGLETVMSSPQGITSRDRWDTTTCDAVLMNLLGATKVSIGTMIEAGWASQARVPLIVVMEAGNVHDHPILTHSASFVTPSLETAVHIVKVMFAK